MGLDGVEIVMAVEETFDIRIEDSEAEKIRTPRELIDLVVAKVANVETAICLNHRGFNLGRAFLIRCFGRQRNQITPTAKLAQLVPWTRRAMFVRRLVNELGSNPPPVLLRPFWLKVLLVAISVAVGLFAAIRMAATTGVDPWLLFLVMAVFTGMIGGILTKPLRREFPKEMATAGDLAHWIKTHKPDLANKTQKAWARDQIATGVRDIVIKVIGCGSQYREDARFIEDLGLG